MILKLGAPLLQDPQGLMGDFNLVLCMMNHMEQG